MFFFTHIVIMSIRKHPAANITLLNDTSIKFCIFFKNKTFKLQIISIYRLSCISPWFKFVVSVYIAPLASPSV
jgi:hypothetical protein